MTKATKIPISEVFRLTIIENQIYKCKTLILISIFNIYYLFRCKKIQRGISKRLKLRKRFALGCYLGYTISKFIQKDESGLKFRKHFQNGIFYGYWGISIITLDFVVDGFTFDKNTVQKVYSRCSNILTSGNTTNPETWNNQSNFLIQTIEIVEILFTVLHNNVKHLNNCVNEFYADAKNLLGGQFYSIEQKFFSSQKDFRWYFTAVINQKTLKFYLAPIKTFCSSEKSIRNYKQLEKAFFKLNDCYFHWQAIDDVADIQKDVNDSILTTPSYIIISQGVISEKLRSLFLKLNDPVTQKVLETEIDQSLLTMEPFSFITIFNSQVANDENFIFLRKVKIALCNTDADLKKNLLDLINEKITLKNILIDSYSKKDNYEILQCIKRSNSCRRILLAAQNPIYINALSNELIQQDISLKITLKTLNRIMEKTLRKAQKAIND